MSKTFTSKYTGTEIESKLDDVSNKVDEAPSDGASYLRKDGEWIETSSGGDGSVDVVQTTGASTTAVMSQNAISNANLYLTRNTQKYEEGSGTPFSNVIEKCTTTINSNISKYVTSENTAYTAYDTYYYTNTETSVNSFIYANISGVGNATYRSAAIFDVDENLLFQTTELGECVFVLRPSHTIYITIKNTTDIAPRYGVTLLSESTYIGNKISNAITGYYSTKQLTCWGDSLTAGAGGSNGRNQSTILEKIRLYSGLTLSGLTDTSTINYPIMLGNLLGSDWVVNNCGVGGESINTVAARIGANSIFAPAEFVLPSSGSVTIANNSTNKLNSGWGSDLIALLLQGSSSAVNPVYVNGVECTLAYNSSTYDYTLTRVAEGDRDITVSEMTPIVPCGAGLYRNTEIAVIWCWQNGGYSDNDELIEKLDKVISHCGTDKYILVGIHSGTKSSRAAQEAALVSKYGGKFFNWRDYVSTNALYDFGITPTTDEDFTQVQLDAGVRSDTYQMSVGSLPSSFWCAYIGDSNGSTGNDSTHLVADGYAILGYKLYERMIALGYID